MMHCLIIEDEPLAADILVDYLQQLPHLKLVSVCPDAQQGLAALHQHKVDILFLDIHLPGLKGLDLLKTLAHRPAVILTTAYHQYALQGYELDVTDYLLKPIEFSRFVEAVNKAMRTLASGNEKEILTVHSDKKTVLIPLDDILFIESQKEYIKIQTRKGEHLVKYALSKIETELNPLRFVRIHRSFIVSIQKISAFNANEVELEGKTIPIGGNYKDDVAQRLLKLTR